MQSKLLGEALDRNTSQEIFQQSSTCVKKTIISYPIETVDKILKSKDCRMNQLLKSKWQRLK